MTKQNQFHQQQIVSTELFPIQSLTIFEIDELSKKVADRLCKRIFADNGHEIVIKDIRAKNVVNIQCEPRETKEKLKKNKKPTKFARTQTSEFWKNVVRCWSRAIERFNHITEQQRFVIEARKAMHDKSAPFITLIEKAIGTSKILAVQDIECAKVYANMALNHMKL